MECVELVGPVRRKSSSVLYTVNGAELCAVGTSSPFPSGRRHRGGGGWQKEEKKILMKDRKLREYLEGVLAVGSARSDLPQMVYGDELKQDNSEA